MKTLVLSLVILSFAGWASAQVATQMSVGEDVVPPPPQFEFYCQMPNSNLWTANASTGFGSAVFDDILDEFTGTDVLDVVFYVSEWAGYWTDPAGVYVLFTHAECPPGDIPDVTVYLPWSSLNVELIWDDPGNFTCYRCVGYLPDPILIQEDMSIGFQVDNTWDGNPPYCGIVLTEYNVVYGDCEAYWFGEYWGYEGYISGYFVDMADVAYCLSDGTEYSPHIDMIGCYDDGPGTVIYLWSATAGNAPVNDIEICLYDEDGVPANIVSCSVPGSWQCHFDPGTNCIYYHTLDNPILPGETLEPFDFWLSPCHEVTTVVWTFTYDGSVVEGPYTSYFDCGISPTRPATWGGIKSLYK
jgi:hypothetical protein